MKPRKFAVYYKLSPEGAETFIHIFDWTAEDAREYVFANGIGWDARTKIYPWAVTRVVAA
jgi:hypothetical protein